MERSESLEQSAVVSSGITLGHVEENPKRRERGRTTGFGFGVEREQLQLRKRSGIPSAQE